MTVMASRLLVLTPPDGADRLRPLMSDLPAGTEWLDTADLAVLDRMLTAGDRLIAFGSGEIIPPELLDRCRLEPVNFHAASPDYPGRDPHHWAAYDGAGRYGATAHIMNQRVDAGPIIGTELFEVTRGTPPSDLLAAAGEAALRLFRRLLPALTATAPLSPTGQAWSGRKRRRADFIAMCRLSLDLGEAEIERRLFAFHSHGHSNFSLRIGNRIIPLGQPVEAD